MKKIFFLFSLISSTAFANLHLAPPDFDVQNGRAIFVDFKKADYSIHYDMSEERATVRTRITFEAKNSGFPLFDLVPCPKSMLLDGKKVNQDLIKFPGGVSQLRKVNQVIGPGIHVLELSNEISTNLSFHGELGSVSQAFWIRDLKDRMFLEQYIPSNFEFDQYEMNLNLSFEGVEEIEQDIYTNGVVTKNSPTSWSIKFPAHYTVSCPYFHMTPQGWMRRLDFNYLSLSGKNIPITVYSPWKKRTKRFKAEALRVMQELEADYGPWGHDGFVAYGTMKGTGGMEHAGATATSFGALDHEMLHSYFAKGVIPANGNSGWIDEAIASWRDKGYQRLLTPGFSGSNLGSQSVYKRNTDSRAYALGAAFMGYLDYRLQDHGGLKAFLRGYFHAYKHQVITTEHFKNNLEFFSGLNLDAEFETYIWGENAEDSLHHIEENPHHKALSTTQLKSIL